MTIFRLPLLPLAAMLEVLALVIAWALVKPYPSAALRISMLAERLPDTDWYFKPRIQAGSKHDQG